MQFSDPRAYDVLALGALAATLVLSHWIETSRLGYALRALKENEQAAEAMGVDTFRAKMFAYVLSAAPAAAPASSTPTRSCSSSRRGGVRRAW